VVFFGNFAAKLKFFSRRSCWSVNRDKIYQVVRESKKAENLWIRLDCSYLWGNIGLSHTIKRTYYYCG